MAELKPKYVVFKRDEWERFVEGGDIPEALEHCFILRAQDIFGTAALWAYAHILQTVLELGDTRPVFLTPEEHQRTADLAESVAAYATLWGQLVIPRKIPD